MNSKFADILNIANSLTYTSFGIGGDIFTAESSIRNQTTGLTEFDDSFRIYCNDVEQMESNICLSLGKISGVSEGISSVGSSSIISSNGELVDSFKIQALILKDPEELTDVEKQYLKYIKNIIGEDQYKAMENVYTPEEANEYINSSLWGMNTGKKAYFANEISNIPKQITYKSGKYTYIYMLQKSPGPTLFGMEVNSSEDIITKDGKTLDTNMYNYECVYTDEPEGPPITLGMIVSPLEVAGVANVAKISGTGTIAKGISNTKLRSNYEERIAQTPINNGKWTGERAESTFISNNVEASKILKKVGRDGVDYSNAIPDFSIVSQGKVKIEGMSIDRRINFKKADTLLAEKLGKTTKEVVKMRKMNDMTWHELNDMETMQLVPTIINSKFGHLGGVSEVSKLIK